MAYTILFATPYDIDRELLMPYLIKAGYAVDVALSVEDFKEKFGVKQYDGIIIDGDFGHMREQEWHLLKWVYQVSDAEPPGVLLASRKFPLSFYSEPEIHKKPMDLAFYPLDIKDFLGRIEHVIQLAKRS